MLSILQQSENRLNLNRHNCFDNLFFVQQEIYLLSLQSRDTEEITRFFIIQLKQLIQIILRQFKQTKSNKTYEQLKESIVKCLIKLLKSDILEFKQDVAKMLAIITPSLEQIDRTQIIFKEAISLTQNSSEQDKIIAIQILSHLSECFSQQYCDQYIAKQILLLGQDQSIRVRKQAIFCLPSLSKLVSKQLFESKLIEFYLKKCQQNAWAVRKVCVQIIYELSKQTNNQIIKQKLQNSLLIFLKDSNKMVKASAHKFLPNFIATLSTQLINKKFTTANNLVQQYIKLIDSEINNQISTNEILKNISYTFPAVLLALGKEKWKQLSSIYNRLIVSKDKNIRIPLGCSLHEVAKILGPQLSIQYLFNSMDNILKQEYDDIKIGVIQHLSEFVQVFDMQTRENLIDVFLNLQKDNKKWRIRYLLANQLQNLCKIYHLETIFKYFLPISFKLCSDPVYEVRKIASENIWILVEIFKNQSTFLYVTLQSIKGFAQSTKFNQRQSFLIMCKKLWPYKEIFIKQIFPCLQKLRKDKAATVRILLAQLIFLINNGNNEVKNEQLIKQISKQLQSDEMDIKDALNGI